MKLYTASLIIFCLFFSARTGSSNPAPEVKGMTISCQTWGWEWGSDEMVDAMRELAEIGVNWIAIHPYARIQPDGSLRIIGAENDETYAWLTRPIQEAHRLGLQICIKPHIAYWGTGFRWRGEIAFDTPDEWDRFFDSYGDWLVMLGDVCRDADAFVIGTELDQTVAYDDEWRGLIKRLRTVTDAPLTYAANWSHYKDIAFWDELDGIGIQAYFPLAESPAETNLEDLVTAWNRHLEDLNAYAERWGKNIVFTELGYDNSSSAACRPWESGRRGTPAQRLQERCLESAMRALAEEDRIIGAFVWKWFAGRVTHENFLASTPPMRRVIKNYWDTADRERAAP